MNKILRIKVWGGAWKSMLPPHTPIQCFICNFRHVAGGGMHERSEYSGPPRGAAACHRLASQAACRIISSKITLLTACFFKHLQVWWCSKKYVAKSANNIRPSVCILFISVLLLCGCGIYTNFESPRDELTQNAFGTAVAADTFSMGDLHWRNFFSDQKLCALIETALKNNADMQTTMLNVQIAQASLRASKLAFFPSFDFSPSATRNEGSWEVQLPVNAGWEIDLFGSLRNAKKKRQAALMETEAYAQAVRSQLIGTVAATYYSLLCLDVQYEIYEQTEKSWKQNVEVTRYLMNAGRYNSASLSQTEASYYDVLNNLIDIGQQIQATENQLCSLIGETPRNIERGTMDDWQSPAVIGVGIPAQALSARPDVRQAEMVLAQAFYGTNEARSSFYPSVTINGSYDFKETVYGIVGSLFQPLFQRGALRANLNIAKAEHSQAAAAFKQAIIDAGIEVNDALAAVRAAQEKQKNYTLQVGHLEDAVNSTRLLMNHGSTTYLEVLTAQQTLLSAQISRTVNDLSGISGVITLYQALGGGRDN